MAITDPFTFTHNSKTRSVDVLQIRFNVGSELPEMGMGLKAETWLDATDDIDAQRVQLRNAEFSQAETIAAFQAQLTAMSLTMTNAQVGQLITGAAEQAVRIRWED